MSEGKRRTALRFSLGFTAFQALFFAAAAWLFAYFVGQFWFHADEIAASPNRGRYAWVGDLANADGGKVGVLMFAALAVLCLWYSAEAGWRFFSGGRAAQLTERGLLLHPSYRRRGEIPYADVLSAEVGEESSSGWLFKRHRLLIAFAGRRDVRLRSVTTDGGLEALEEFANELNGRRRLAAVPNQV